MKRNYITRTLLALAVSSALTACNTDDEGLAETRSPESATASGSAETGSKVQGNTLQEISITGSRSTVSDPSGATPAASAAMVTTGARISSDVASLESSVNAPTARAGFSGNMDGATAITRDAYVYPRPAEHAERYADIVDNGTQRVTTAPVSTFSIDVDSGAYSNVRRFLSNGQLPPADAVRAEELINYFDYDYPPSDGDVPFSIATEIAPSPYNDGRHVLHIGIEANDPSAEEKLPANLVFLVDVSGSMASADKLGLLQSSLKMLSRQLTAQDSIAIVVYAGASGVVLPPTPGNETALIAAALDQLAAGGSTNGAAGIVQAYNLAQQHFIEDGINRVLLATDGDFNVGMTDFDALEKLVSDRRASGISLTTLGFGTGNYNDHLMEQLADAGNGNYAYIDTINEARKVLVDEVASTLHTVAADVKIQIEFNPAVVSEYRLIGYENRMLAEPDFNNDKVDAGEIGAGHSVTALYEITLAGSDAAAIEALRYATAPQALQNAPSDELAYLKLRYKTPGDEQSILLERAVPASAVVDNIEASSPTFRFAAAVAGFAQLLRDNTAVGAFDYDTVLGLATGARGDDAFGYRAEFINLVKTAQALD